MLIPKRLSYSALSTYSECGERFRLERGHGISSHTWWATLGGSAVHEITELMDARGLGFDVEVPTWDEAFKKQIERVKEGEEIRPSGRKLKEIGATGGPNKKDKEWWDIYGPLYVQAWADWREESGWKIAQLPSGDWGIEVRIEAEIAGKPVLGFIDRIFEVNGELIIVDLKCGNAPPGNTQLGVYGAALKKIWGIDVEWGGFWMASKGDLKDMVDLTTYTEEYIENLFGMAWRGIENGVFLPAPSSFCGSCSVNEYCRSYQGERSADIPIVEIMTEPPPF